MSCHVLTAGAKTSFLELEVDDGLTWEQALGLKKENVDALVQEGATEGRLKKVRAVAVGSD